VLVFKMYIRSGFYALYFGNWYKAGEKNVGSGDIILISFDPVDCNLGFKESKYTMNRFTKQVKLEELEEAYYVTTYTEYKGYKFSVSESKEDGMCALFTGNSKEAEELGFEFIDRMSYWKSVKLQDLTKIWEELEPIWGFEGEKEIRILKG
jgi:hypothetical protein